MGTSLRKAGRHSETLPPNQGAHWLLQNDLLEMILRMFVRTGFANENVVSADWDGAVPIPEVVKWLTEWKAGCPGK